MKPICTGMTFLVLLLSTPSLNDAFAADTDIKFNELMYNPAGADGNREWIEVANTGSTPIDMNDWKLREDATAHSLPLADPLLDNYDPILSNTDAVLAPGEYAIISDDPAEFLTDYFAQNAIAYVGTLFDSSWGGLTNDGELLELENSSGSIIDSIDYSAPFIIVVEGRSLEKKNPSLPSNDANSWGESVSDGGTPGEDNSIFDLPLPVVLSDFVAFPTEQGIMLEWRTESELNHVGWNIHRRPLNRGVFDRINNEIIPGSGNVATSRTYRFVDRSAQPEQEYEYYLESIDIQGKSSQSPIIRISDAPPPRMLVTWAHVKASK